MNNFIFGQYIPGKSPVHRMNPASKFLLCILFIIMDLSGNNWLDYFELSILILISIMASQISFKTLYHGIKPLVLFIFFTAVLQLFFSSNGLIIFKWGLIKLSTGGLSSSCLVFCRFLLIIIISTILTLSTPPTELADGVRIILKPLSYLKVPVNLISLMISVALRFIPTLYEELMTIVKAQESRGMLFHSGNLTQRIKKMALLIMPLLFSSFERARKLSYAMLARGYQSGIKRTRLQSNHLSFIDLSAWLIYFTFGIIEIMSRR